MPGSAPIPHAPAGEARAHPPRPSSSASEPLLLAGDVGGTKTVMALVHAVSGTVAAEATFPSREYESFHAVVSAFRRRYDAPVQRAAFSVAGPVMNGRARITNLPWRLDADELAGALGVDGVLLVNDLQATARSVPHLLPHQLRTIHPGEGDPRGVRAVVAVGTGLGEAMLIPCAGGFQAFPSEGGHTDFAPRNAVQRALLASLQTRYEHVSYERVCSGQHGIPNLYRFLADRSTVPAPPGLATRLAQAADPTPAIVQAGLAPDGCRTCRRTLRLFAAILGAQAGNVALRTIATGGVYIGGGIPPRVLPALRSRAFRDGFRRKGPMSDLVGRIPVHVILEPRAALLGAARYGMEAGVE